MDKKEQINESVDRGKRVINNAFRLNAYSTLRKLLIGFILISIANVIYSELFYTPKIHQINKRNSELSIKYSLLRSRISAAQTRVNEIAHRDNYVYRSLFGVDSISIEGIDTPYPDSKYASLQGNPYSIAMTQTWRNIDQLAKNLYLRSISLDELQVLSQNKENLSAAIPAIWPIDRTKLRSVCHYGMRMHPLYGRYIMHKGIDLGSPKGTPIFATGDGVVEKSVQGMRYKGYGQEILINHEYNYKTRYGHLSKRYVNRGDSVKRGQLIGEVGSTGGSDGPHLHYEVIYKGAAVNPINYFDRNMTNEEYVELMENMKRAEYEIIDNIDENGN